MKTEEKKNDDKKTNGHEFKCCTPDNFQRMFSMMSRCCPRRNNSADYSTVMKNMMDMCAGMKTSEPQPDGTDS